MWLGRSALVANLGQLPASACSTKYQSVADAVELQ